MNNQLRAFARKVAKEILEERFELDGDELADRLYTLSTQGHKEEVEAAVEAGDDFDIFVEILMNHAQAAALEAVTHHQES